MRKLRLLRLGGSTGQSRDWNQAAGPPGVLQSRAFLTLDSGIEIGDVFPSTLMFTSFLPKYMISCPPFVPENLLFKI